MASLLSWEDLSFYHGLHYRKQITQEQTQQAELQQNPASPDPHLSLLYRSEGA